MSGREVAVVGGGVAGIAASLDLARARQRVTLYEVRPRLGGAAYSFSRDGLLLDNGVHVALRCCSAYVGLLEELGSGQLLAFQDRLEVPFLGPAGRRARVGRDSLPAPLHLARSLLSYPFLSLSERIAAARAVQALGRVDPAAREAQERSLADFLAARRLPQRAVRELLEPILLPLLNAPVDDVSLAIAAFTVRTGLLGAADAADIGLHRAPLLEVIGKPALRRLAEVGVEVRLKTRVWALERREGGWRLAIEREGAADHAGPYDAVIVALPHSRAAVLLEEAAVGEGERPRLEALAARLAGLGSEPIVNLHLIFRRPVTDLPFFGAVRSPVQYVFDRTEAAGLKSGQYLAVSLSAARRELALSTARLRELYLPALAQLLPEVAKTPLDGFYVSKEHAATFRPAPGSEALRPDADSGLPGLFLAGAYTNTGWPATLEGATRSGQAAARAALAALAEPARSFAGEGS